DLAIHHFTEASATDELGRLLADHGPDLIKLSRFELIKRAFDSHPLDAFSVHPGALIARADIALMEGDDNRALALYEAAELLARQSGQALIQAEAMRGQAYIVRHRGEPEKSIELAQSALDLAPDNHPLRARCFNVIGLSRFFSLQDAPGAVKSWQAA